ncbi:hypothetical protein M0R45_008147 [Rubus argutus]|uniref:Secreted protein n=1 Tax=Rubus argutus TaxID=59490 RepID=A0AAW1Y177_RUBAR
METRLNIISVVPLCFSTRAALLSSTWLLGTMSVSSLGGHGGSGWHQPVILPLQREGGNRCSVKPASRIALLSRNHETQSLRSSHTAQLLAWNGRVRIKPIRIQPTNAQQMFQHPDAPTWVISSRNQARR